MPKRRKVRRRRKAADLIALALSQSGIWSRGTPAPAADCSSPAPSHLPSEPVWGSSRNPRQDLVSGSARGLPARQHWRPCSSRAPPRSAQARGQQGRRFPAQACLPGLPFAALRTAFPGSPGFPDGPRAWLLALSAVCPPRASPMPAADGWWFWALPLWVPRPWRARCPAFAWAQVRRRRRRGHKRQAPRPDRGSPYNARAEKTRASGYFYRRPSLAGSCGRLHNPPSRSRPVTCPGRY